jgi:phosphoribosylformylglycinamidine synthase PurS subunit
MPQTGEIGMVIAEVRVELKKGVADPEGRNTLKALELLGFQGLRDVKTVKVFDIDLDDGGDVGKKVDEMCRRLLANPVIHNYSIRIK